MLLTVPHELVDLLGAALWSVHSVVFLQQLVHLGQVNSGVGRHAVGGDLPQQHTKCWRCRQLVVLFIHQELNDWNVKTWWEYVKYYNDDDEPERNELFKQEHQEYI